MVPPDGESVHSRPRFGRRMARGSGPARTGAPAWPGAQAAPVAGVARQLADALDRRTLAARRIGELKHRESPGVPGGYLSNGCVECDALIGRFHLEDLLHERLMQGGTYSQLDIGVPVELPLGVPARLTALG